MTTGPYHRNYYIIIAAERDWVINSTD